MWNKVLWLAESNTELFDRCKIYTYQKKDDPEYMIFTVKHGSCSIKLWETFFSSRKKEDK